MIIYSGPKSFLFLSLDVYFRPFSILLSFPDTMTFLWSLEYTMPFFYPANLCIPAVYTLNFHILFPVSTYSFFFKSIFLSCLISTHFMFSCLCCLAMYPGCLQTANPLALIPVFWDYGHAQLFPLYITPFRPNNSPITTVSLDLVY